MIEQFDPRTPDVAEIEVLDGHRQYVQQAAKVAAWLQCIDGVGERIWTSYEDGNYEAAITCAIALGRAANMLSDATQTLIGAALRPLLTAQETAPRKRRASV